MFYYFHFGAALPCANFYKFDAANTRALFKRLDNIDKY